MELAPSADILAAFGKDKKVWPTYELAFLDLMKKRVIKKQLDPAVIKGGCLLCREATPHHCHRVWWWITCNSTGVVCPSSTSTEPGAPGDTTVET